VDAHGRRRQRRAGRLERRRERAVGLLPRPSRSYLGWERAQPGRRFGPQMVPLDGAGRSASISACTPRPARPRLLALSARPVVTSPAAARPPVEEPRRTPRSPRLARELQRTSGARLAAGLDLVGLPLPPHGSGQLRPRPGSACRAGSARSRPGAYLSASAASTARASVVDARAGDGLEPHHARGAERSASPSLARQGCRRGRVDQDRGTRENEWVTARRGTNRRTGASLAAGLDPGTRSTARCAASWWRTTATPRPRSAARARRLPDNHWSATRETWLQWAFEPLAARTPQPEDLCHIFTERPVYRPDETVHVKATCAAASGGRSRRSASRVPS